MYAIKLNPLSKQLHATVKSKIYQHEQNVDSLLFLVPTDYNDHDLTTCSILLRYILPDGTGVSEELDRLPELYKTHQQCVRSVTSKFTDNVGEIELWLTFVGFNDEIIMKTGTAIVEIAPSLDITDYMSNREKNQMDRLQLQVNKLQVTKADDMLLTEDNFLQLLADGKPIGTPIEIKAGSGQAIKKVIVNEDGDLIITFADDTEENAGRVLGTTFIPAVSDDYILSWTNNGELENPKPVDIYPFNNWEPIEDPESGETSHYFWERF